MIELIREASEEHPVASVMLMNVLGLSERMLREFVEYARGQGIPIAKGNKGGYFIAKTWEQFKPTFLKNCNQDYTNLKNMHRLRRSFSNYGQPTVFDVSTDYDELLEFVDFMPEPQHEL